MTTKRIVYEADATGHVHVVTPATDGRRPDESESDWLGRVMEKAVPSSANVAVIGDSRLPKSRRFRSAWRLRAALPTDPPSTVARVDVDLDAAKAALEAEIPLRKKASPAKIARIRAGIGQARTVEELETLANANGWRKAMVAIAPGVDAEEDV